MWSEAHLLTISTNLELTCHVFLIFSCYRLKDVLIQDQFEHLELESHFSTDFPDSLTLDQAVSLWKHIILYQETIRQY